MIERFRDSRWVYILLSILLAVVFWFYVRAEVNPTSPTWFHNIPVTVTGNNVLTQQNLTVANLSQETVNLKIEAPASVLDSLSRSRSEISVTIDVSKCQEGENKVTYTPNWPTSVSKESIALLDQEPSSIVVTVDKLSTHTFPVEFELQGSVADGYQAGTPAINPESVVVSGPVDQVSQVDRVVAVLSCEDLSTRFAGDLPLTLRNAAGETLTGLDVGLDNESAYVVLPVVVVKEVPLTVNVIPGGGATAADAAITISPESITVSGAKEDLADLSEISLGSVDLAKVVGSNTLTYPISIDSRLENVSGETSASVTVTVEGLSTRNFEVDNIQLSNQPAGFTSTAVTQTRTVAIRGQAAALDALDASQIRIVADLSEFKNAGTYSVPARVYLDAEDSVGVVGEYSISVKISRP